MKALAAIGVKDAKGIVSVAVALFEDPDMSSEVLAAAVPLFTAAGPEGIEKLAVLVRKPLPASVRTQMCITLAETPRVPEDLLDWMIEQVEDLKAVRQAVGNSLAKVGGERNVLELIRRTDVYKPRNLNLMKEEKYAGDYRQRAVATLGKMDFLKTKPTPILARVRERLTYLSSNEQDPNVAAEAKAALVALRR